MPARALEERRSVGMVTLGDDGGWVAILSPTYGLAVEMTARPTLCDSETWEIIEEWGDGRTEYRLLSRPQARRLLGWMQRAAGQAGEDEGRPL